MPAEQTSLGIGHPAPHREAARPGWLIFALIAAPLVWIVELVGNFALTSFVCDEGQSRAALPAVPGWVPPLVAAANVVALIVAVLALAAGIVLLRRTHHEHRERSGEPVDAGEGRTRFLAVWAVATAIIFFVALLANTFSLSLVPICQG